MGQIKSFSAILSHLTSENAGRGGKMGQVKSILREFVPNRKVTEIKCSSGILLCSVLQRISAEWRMGAPAIFSWCNTRWFNRKAEPLQMFKA